MFFLTNPSLASSLLNNSDYNAASTFVNLSTADSPAWSSTTKRQNSNKLNDVNEIRFAWSKTKAKIVNKNKNDLNLMQDRDREIRLGKQ